MNFFKNKWTKEEEEFLLNNHKTLTYKEISSILNKTEISISKKCYRFNLLKKPRIEVSVGSKFANDMIEIIESPFTEKYENYYVSKVKCKCYFCGEYFTTRLSLLHTNNIKSCGCMSSTFCSQKVRKYKVNEQFFDHWSCKMAYISGFIMADGCISANSLLINLQERDREILYFITKSMESIHPIKIKYIKYEYKNNKKLLKQCFLQITSKIIKNSLNNIGITNQKTGKEVMPNEMPEEYFWDFLRGYFDGDGCIYTVKSSCKKRPRDYRMLICCANRKFLEDIKDRIGNFGSIQTKKNKKNLYILQISHNQAIKVRDKMYSDAVFSLERKRNKFYSIGV